MDLVMARLKTRVDRLERQIRPAPTPLEDTFIELYRHVPEPVSAYLELRNQQVLDAIEGGNDRDTACEQLVEQYPAVADIRDVLLTETMARVNYPSTFGRADPRLPLQYFQDAMLSGASRRLEAAGYNLWGRDLFPHHKNSGVVLQPRGSNWRRFGPPDDPDVLAAAGLEDPEVLLLNAEPSDLDHRLDRELEQVIGS
jgi:hypothetical protein